MPMLDVSFVVLDPMFADTFDITRRAESIDSKGRPSLTSTSFPKLVGVITQEDPSSLVRADDSANVPRVISVVTKFQAQGLIKGYQPDLVSWNGTDYVVTAVKPYNRYGSGFYEVTAESMTATDVKQ